MSKNWLSIFSPVMSKGMDSRPSQEILGQAIINAIDHKNNLVAQASTGTGKSLAALVPIISEVITEKKHKKSFRGVISTETLTLQDQIFEKDLPFLYKIYGGFSYRKLMGRSNYFCFNYAKASSVGNSELHSMISKLDSVRSALGDGELKDIERVLGKELSSDTWSKISSNQYYCPDKQCDAEDCFANRARAKALTADIVVINHALLSTDYDMRLSELDDGLLGDFNVLVVDEGHKLAEVLVSQWTKELTERELEVYAGSVAEAVDISKNAISHGTITKISHDALESSRDVVKLIKDFFIEYIESNGNEWQNSSTSLCFKNLNNPTQTLLYQMNKFESDAPIRVSDALTGLKTVEKHLEKSLTIIRENSLGGSRKVSKGLRASRELISTLELISKALETKDGIVDHYGAYGALVDGYLFRDGKYGMTIRLVPLDVSAKAKGIWNTAKTNIMLSATLTDLTDGSFRYAKESVGFPEAKEINVDTPFNLQAQQLVYVTEANRELAEDAQYSFSELVDLLKISKGRALVLFTSRKELDWAAAQLTMMRNSGEFDYELLVQTKEANKAKLAKEFKENTHSVLLATKSFFTGFDASGETLSLVVLCKFPLPRYSEECRQQITHWRKKGFPKWYERESLTVFQQAAGRLIRSNDCKGVVALLDFRCYDAGSRIFKTASLGVSALGSPVTHNLNVVKEFLS